MADEAAWITVGALAHAFSEDSYAPKATTDLAGNTLTLHLAEGGALEYRFESATDLFWAALDGPDAGRDGTTTSGQGGTAAYFAAKLREGLYFVDHLRTDERATSVTLLLDLGRGMATVMTGRLPEEAESRQAFADRIAAGKELTAVSVAFASAAIDRPFTPETPRHQPTLDMVGKRVEYTYSPTECYEHIYLNERFYTWHCLLGSEKGLADTDRCHYYKLADRLYLFVWREKIVPTLGSVVVDLEALRTTGKIFGYQGEGPGGLSNFPVGARARVLNADDDRGIDPAGSQVPGRASQDVC